METAKLVGNRFALYGNNGKYRMPSTPEFDTFESARAYASVWYSGNSFISILPVKPA